MSILSSGISGIDPAATKGFPPENTSSRKNNLRMAFIVQILLMKATKSDIKHLFMAYAY